ncbi:MAG TPA: uroporphyrinogen-III C-methyltransferase [Puia sp.]|jgi:uroporphyrin-III C-methyltransferase/precorrin-2 dehydrogenase/sirohydrochlorin ferrochelatase/uroporphyrin-III C-methyltransferase|nr:uroporphyrinogen-III C-methyltransferase [Puia sp.]
MTKKGKVILAGAGPGDPELLTIKALRWLQKADVVIVDRLVSREALQEYTREDVLIVPVGKKCNDQGSTPQSVINDLLVEYARQGKLVVRLKGGDVSVFSNVLDELQTLISHDIAYELVPGVTAALGAAAYAGIPLTARGYSTALRMLTWYKQDLLNESYIQDLAGTDDTLVFYMSSGGVDTLVEKLLQSGIAADKWIAIIEQATTPNQQVTHYPIHDYLSKAAGNSYASPTLIIVGKVAALHASFGWIPNSDNNEQYFTPLSVASNNLFNKKLPIC